MGSRALVMVLAAAALAACGGDDPEVLTGSIEAGGVQGLRYTTSTQSGTTDARGRFQYVRGETVYFTIGNISLGAATAAEKITLFDLSGLAPPTSERALRRELDRASRRNRTPFAGAMNRQHLLVALDADHDPRNGYDLAGRSSELAGASLDFDLSVFDFDQRLARLSPTVTRNVPLWMPVVLLYRGAGIQMVARDEVHRDQEDIFGQHRISVREHDPDGLRFATRQDLDGDGSWEHEAIMSFDVLGRPTREQVDIESLLLPQRRIHEPSYDVRGNPTSIRDEYTFGVLSTVVSLATITLDAWNREDFRVTEHDFSGDGVIDSRTSIDTEYDAGGNVREVTYETDAAADGSVNSREIFRVEYDTRNRYRSQTWESDTNADGTPESSQSSIGTWSADDREFVEAITADFDGDGVAEQVEERRYELDARGQVRRALLTAVYGPGVASEQEEIFENDDFGRTLLQTSRYEYGGTGPRYLFTTRSQYDDAGNLVHRTSERDEWIDGSVDARASMTASVGTGGELLGAVYEGEWAQFGPESPSTLTITNESFAAGVTVLAQKYFPPPSVGPGFGFVTTAP